jgi:drug/metabolite transporter (DMT)-like permease
MNQRIWGAMLIVYLVWGSTYLAIRFAVETLPPFFMAGTRFLIAGAILYAWRRMAGDPRPTSREWRSTAIVGACLLICGNGGLVWAEQYVPSMVAALIIGSSPIWIVLIDALRPGGVRPDRQTVLGLAVGFAGIALLVVPGETSNGAQSFGFLGVGVLLFSAVAWALGSVYGSTAPLPSSPLLATGMEMLAGGAGLFVLGMIAGDWSRLDLGMITFRSFSGWLYLIVFGSLIGFAAYTWLLRVAPLPFVATYAYVNPLVAIVLGSVLAQEQITVNVILSAAIIIGAVVLINSSRFRRIARQPSPIVSSALGED